MNLIAPLVKAVQMCGFDNPTPIQEETIPYVLAGKDILGCAQTGTGKTAAFTLPILQRIIERKAAQQTIKGYPIRALILAPTRELAIQNYENALLFSKKLPVRISAIYGGVNQARQVEALKRGVDILVATPGRLNDLIGQGFVKLNAIEIFVLDEADRMLDMGFLPDIKKIISLLPEERQTLLFSATMPAEIEKLALTMLKQPVTVKISPVTSTVEKITQSVYFVEKSNKKDLLLHLLTEKGVFSALVFTRTKRDADQITRVLQKHKLEAAAIHGDKSQNARQRALNRFKAGEVSVLVATDIAARGIDITELPFVINYNIPEEAETYIHRIGRTGRAGFGGSAISFCCSDELTAWRDIEKLTQSRIPEEHCPWSVAQMQPTKVVRKSNTGRRPAPNAVKNKNRRPAPQRSKIK